MVNALESLSKEDLLTLIRRKDLLLETNQKHLLEKESEIIQKNAEIDKLRRMLFGQKRERFEISPIQLPLDFGDTLSEQELKELEEFINKKTEAVKQQENKAPRGPHPGRSPLPKHLSVQELVLEPQEDTADMVLIGKEVSDSLQYEPSRFYIQRIVRPKYAPKAANVIDESVGIVIAELPQSGFGKCIAGTGLIAQILIDRVGGPQVL